MRKKRQFIYALEYEYRIGRGDCKFCEDIIYKGYEGNYGNLVMHTDDREAKIDVPDWGGSHERQFTANSVKWHLGSELKQFLDSVGEGYHVPRGIFSDFSVIIIFLVN